MIDESALSKIEEFRSHLTDLELQDEYAKDRFLYPFLIAQKMDMQKARIQLENAMNWRAEYAGILDWVPPKGMAELCPYEVIGEDLQGRPVSFGPFGKWDIKKAIKDYGREDYLKYFFQMLFKFEDIGRKSCKNDLISVVMIWNYDGFRMGQLTSSAVVSATIETTKICEYFPGFYERFYLLKVSRWAEMFMKILYPFMSEDFSGAIRTISSDDKFKADIINYISLDQLPKEIGGSRA